MTRLHNPRLAASPQDTGIDVSHGPRESDMVALTFDDGRDAGAVRDLLAALSATSAVVTFFPQANAVAGAPGAWAEVAAAGHPVGNHTVTHPDLRTLPDDLVREEIADFRRLVDPILGIPSIPWFRPPYGSWDSRVADLAAQEGYRRILLWDVDTHDWSGLSPTVLAASALEGGAGSIILMHAGPVRTVAALPAIIAGFHARGLRLVSVPELLGQDG